MPHPRRSARRRRCTRSWSASSTCGSSTTGCPGSLEVGDGAGHPADAVQPTAGEPTGFELAAETIRGAAALTGANSSSRVPGMAAFSIAVPVERQRPCGQHAIAHHRSGFAAATTDEIVDPGAVDADDEIEAIEQRARQATKVTMASSLVALAVARPAAAARTRVGGGDEEEPRRQRGAGTGPGDADDAFLERLPKGVERSGCELAELVQEEDATMAEAGFAGPQTVRAAANQRDQRTRVVRCAERGLAHHARPGQPRTCRRVHHGGFERSRAVERRQQPDDALGQHRLAGPGRADEQQVVPTGRRQLERHASTHLAAHVGEVGWRRLVGPVGCRRWIWPPTTGERVHDLAQRRHGQRPRWWPRPSPRATSRWAPPRAPRGGMPPSAPPRATRAPCRRGRARR